VLTVQRQPAIPVRLKRRVSAFRDLARFLINSQRTEFAEEETMSGCGGDKGIDGKKDRCPFCWDRALKELTPPAGAPSQAIGPRLSVCEGCERWIWLESGEELPLLFSACQTRLENPEVCAADIPPETDPSHVSALKRRRAEFNYMCSACLYGRFYPAEKQFAAVFERLLANYA
jgi:hypothetical protein